MAITTAAGLETARLSAQRVALFRTNFTSTAGVLVSAYRPASGTGIATAASAIPTGAALCSSTDTVDIVWRAATGGAVTYLDTVLLMNATVASWALYDRIMHSGGLDGTALTAQNVNTQTVLTLPAARGWAAEQVEWFLEFYVTSSNAATTASVAVTYTDATTGNVTVSFTITSTFIGRLFPIPPATGKTIASIQSVTLAATLGAVGNFGVTCGAKLGGSTVGTLNIAQVQRGGMLIPVDLAGLWFVATAGPSSGSGLLAEISLVQG